MVSLHALRALKQPFNHGYYPAVAGIYQITCGTHFLFLQLNDYRYGRAKWGPLFQ